MDPKILLEPIPPHQRRLTEEIDAAYRRGDAAEVDALLIAKMILVRREAGVAIPDGRSLKGAA